MNLKVVEALPVRLLTEVLRDVAKQTTVVLHGVLGRPEIVVGVLLSGLLLLACPVGETREIEVDCADGATSACAPDDEAARRTRALRR